MIQPSIIFKIITGGDGGVGKTTMLRRYIEGKFSFDTKMTIGVEIFHKIVTLKNGHTCSLQLWDFGGQERFRFFLDNFVRGAMGSFLMYDVTDRFTFDNLSKWVEIVRKYDPRLPIVLLGAKCDLTERIEVSDETTNEFMDRYKISCFYRISSKTGYNINEAFEALTNFIVDYKGIKLLDQSMET